MKVRITGVNLSNWPNTLIKISQALEKDVTVEDTLKSVYVIKNGEESDVDTLNEVLRKEGIEAELVPEPVAT